mgnify:CR=1 FL=1
MQLTSTDRQPQRLVIDYAVHHLGADGGLRPKVFKGWTLDLAPGEQRVLRKAHPLRPVTIRRYRSGRHEVDLRINGQIVARAVARLDMITIPSPSTGTGPRPR